jgi:hypothetical protein
MCTFLDPGRLAATSLKISGAASVQYMCEAMHRANAESKKFILLPYHE